MVKANAYGLGAKNICKAIDNYVDYFAVSSSEEFFDIKNVVLKPIMILDPIYKNITKLAKYNCEFCVSNFEQLDLILIETKKNKNIEYRVHIAVNSGMNRFGFKSQFDFDEVICKIRKTQNVIIIGVFSHFYCGNDKNFVNLQQNIFLKIVNNIYCNKQNSDIIFHIANTIGYENCKDFDMIRIGLGLFLNNNNIPFSLLSKIIEINNIKSGDTVGYGRNFISKTDMKIGVVSIGYADGIFRNITKKGKVIVNGEFCKILAVCMDSIIINLSNVFACIGDAVTLVGKNGDKQIFVCDIAKWCDTIEYEIMTHISKRVKRTYIGGNYYANHNRKISCEKTCCS